MTNKRIASVFALCLTLWIVVSSYSQPTTVELILEEKLQGYTGTRDTTIYQESLNTNGGGQYLFVGNNADGSSRRALITFDLSAIPKGAKVVFVSLQLTVSKTTGDKTKQTLHRLTKDWGEGTTQATSGREGGGTAPARGDATWQSNFHEVSTWTKPGAEGDFASAPSAVAEVGGSGSTSVWTSEQMIADVQQWVDGATQNFGWILIGDETSIRTTKRYTSADNASAKEGERPRLIVRYFP
ncbi:DNRLRE domain-containing protein [Candidatus Acetothermia bacterium]|nr:DNRLRE domain-containing protein [Candidatus Acetothermia bacterium]